MTTTINASPTNGLVQTADGSGVLKVQSNGVTTNALAWVNFNGTGTVAIRSSYNVSSITDNGTGSYTVNFASALSDINYVISLAVSPSYGVRSGTITSIDVDNAAAEVAPTTTTCRFYCQDGAGNALDPKYVNVAIFGN